MAFCVHTGSVLISRVPSARVVRAAGTQLEVRLGKSLRRELAMLVVNRGTVISLYLTAQSSHSAQRLGEDWHYLSRGAAPRQLTLI